MALPSANPRSHAGGGGAGSTPRAGGGDSARDSATRVSPPPRPHCSPGSRTPVPALCAPCRCSPAPPCPRRHCSLTPLRGVSPPGASRTLTAQGRPGGLRLSGWGSPGCFPRGFCGPGRQGPAPDALLAAQHLRGRGLVLSKGLWWSSRKCIHVSQVPRSLGKRV